MSYTEQAIKKAGYKDHGSDEMYTAVYGRTERESKFEIELLLDPSFWQSLGKSMGWQDDKMIIAPESDGGEVKWTFEAEWKWKWHRFIDHLAAGKDAESYFEALLK